MSRYVAGGAMKIEEETPCRRHKKEIDGGNYYLSVGVETGHEFIQATIPRENDLENHDERVAVDNYCSWLTANGFYGEVAISMLISKIQGVRR